MQRGPGHPEDPLPSSEGCCILLLGENNRCWMAALKGEGSQQQLALPGIPPAILTLGEILHLLPFLQFFGLI